MKKIFTLLFATAMLGTAFAQYGQRGKQNRGPTKSNDIFVANAGYNNHHTDFRGYYMFTEREKNMQIAHINRIFDQKVREVRGRLFMNWLQKTRIINRIENQRDQEIRQVVFKFNSPMNKFGRNNDRKNRHRRNNW